MNVNTNNQRQGATTWFRSWFAAGPGSCARRGAGTHARARAKGGGGPESSGLVTASPEERGLLTPALLVIRTSRDLNFQVDQPPGGRPRNLTLFS